MKQRFGSLHVHEPQELMLVQPAATLTNWQYPSSPVQLHYGHASMCVPVSVNVLNTWYGGT